MTENPAETADKLSDAAEAASGVGPSSGDATYQVRFSNFWSGAIARNSFDLARRGEIRFAGGAMIVHAFRREMLFMGTRIELAFSRADITDVFQLAKLVSFRIAPPNQDAQTLQFWAKDEEDARRIAQALPTTMSAGAAAVKEYAGQLAALDRGDLVTKILVAANILVFGIAGIAGAGFVVPNVEVLQGWGTNIGPLTTSGQWWRLVTSMFLHFGAFHVAFNMWALFIGGRLAERLFGSWAFALLYLVSGVAGSLSSLLWNPVVNSAGASGAIFGVYSAVLAFFLRKHSSIPASIINQQRWSGVVFIGYNLMNGFSHAGIDNADHLGGLGVGFLLGLVLARPLEPIARAKIAGASFYVRGVVASLLLIGILLVSVHFSPAGNAPEQAFRRDIIDMTASEKQARQFANDAFDQLHNRLITPKAFAEQIENEVLPRWTTIQTTFAKDRVPDDSKLKPLWELLNDYSESRVAAYKLFESGARQANIAEFRAGQTKLDQGEIDLKLIRDLNQRQK